MILVMAGNYEQFLHYARKFKWDGSYRYLSREDMIRGFRGEVIRCGTWHDNPAYSKGLEAELYHRIRSGQITTSVVFDHE